MKTFKRHCNGIFWDEIEKKWNFYSIGTLIITALMIVLFMWGMAHSQQVANLSPTDKIKNADANLKQIEENIKYYNRVLAEALKNIYNLQQQRGAQTILKQQAQAELEKTKPVENKE